jgi:hypothetical protein
MKSHYMFFLCGILKHLHGNTTIRYEGLNIVEENSHISTFYYTIYV